MKNMYLFFLTTSLLVFNMVCLGQDNKSIFDDLSFIKKNDIQFIEFSKIKFDRFSQNHDLAISHDSKSNVYKYTLESSAVIPDEKSNIEKGAIIGGISGLFVGVIAGGIANPDNSAIDLLGEAIEGNDVSGSLNQDQVPFIVGGVLAGVTIGILIAAIRGETTMYEKKSKVEFQPVFAYIPGQSSEMLLSFRWNFD